MGSYSDKKDDFTMDEINQLAIKSLKGKIKEGISKRDLLDIYWTCSIGRNSNDSLIIDPAASTEMKRYAEKYPVEFIKILETEDNYSNTIDSKAFHYSIETIFPQKEKPYDEFEEFLKTTLEANPKDKELKLISKHWKQYAKNNHKFFIPD
jgi:hypothetical protein